MESKGIQQLIIRLRSYGDDLSVRCEKLAERLGTELQGIAEKLFLDAEVDIPARPDLYSSLKPEVSVSVTKQGDVTVVIAEGEEVYFVEFGAGVYFNGPVGTSPHPYGSELGMTVGSYSKRNPEKLVWGFTKDGTKYVTRGTPASQPMYNAMKYVCDEIDRIAREVFL